MMRRAIIVFSSVAGVVVVLLLALVGIALFVDTDAYRPRLERELTHLLGRQIAAERLSIEFSLYPTLSVRELRVANPSWASRPYFLTATNVELRLDLMALFHGRVEIDAASGQGLDLLLEQGSEGVGNWDFGGSGSSPGSDAVQLPDFDMISLRDASLTWRGNSGGPVNVSIEDAEAVMREDKPFDIKTNFTYRQVPIAANLSSTASLQSLLNGQTLAASIALRSKDAKADLEVTAPQLSELGAASINFSGKGERLDSLSELAGRVLPGWGPYRVSGTAAFAGEGVQVTNLRMFVEGLTATPALRVSRVEIDSGNVSTGLAAETSVQIAGKIDESSFRLDLTTADLARLSDEAEKIPLTADVVLDGFELGVEGRISPGAQSGSFDLATHVKGDVGVPARIFGTGAFTRPLRADLSGQITGDATQVAATGLRGTVAECSVAGDLTIRRTEPGWLGGTLKLGRFDVAAFEFEQQTKGEQGRRINQDKKNPQREGEPAVAAPGWMRAFDADLQLQVESIAGLPVALSNLSARGTLHEGRLEVHKFRGVINETPVLADGGLQWKDKRPHVDAKIRLPLFDFSNWIANSKARSDSGNNQPERNADRLDSQLPLALLRMFDADISVETGRINGLPVSITNQRGSATLHRGRLRVPQMDATLADVPLRSSLMLDASSDDAHLSATLSSGNVDVADLLKQLEVDTPISGKLGQASATVDTRGASLRDWVRNAKLAGHVEESVLKRQDRETELSLGEVSLIAGPGLNARAESRGKLGEFAFDLSLTGGPLADLLDGQKAWPKVVADAQILVREKTLHVTAGSALDALRRGRDVPMRIDARSDNTTVIAKGTVADLREPARSPLDVEVNVKSLANLPSLVDQSRLPDMPFAANAKAVFDDGLFSLEQLVIRAGETDLSGYLRLYRKERMKLVLDLSGNLIDVRPWLPETSAEVSQKQRAERLDRPFDIDAIRQHDAELRLKARRVIGHRLDLENFNLQSTLENGLLKASAGIAEGESKVTLQFDARSDVSVVGVTASVRNLDRDALKPDSAVQRDRDAPRLSVQAELAGRGTTPREIYASTRGNVLLHAGPGRIQPIGSQFLVETLSSDLLQTLTPGKKPEDYNNLECAAAHFSVTDGVASSPDGIAFRFKRMDLLGSGAVNLSTREILFGFKAVRRKWWSISFLDLAGDFASIGGTIDNPKVGLSPADVIVQGGAAWATLGLSLLATNLFRKLNSAQDPCGQIVEKGRTAITPIDNLLKSVRPGTPSKPR